MEQGDPNFLLGIVGIYLSFCHRRVIFIKIQSEISEIFLT